MLVLRDMWIGGPRRFEDLQRSLGIARNVLADRLGTLVAAGVVERCPYQERPLRHEYRLSLEGEELVPALVHLSAWGDRHLADEAGPPVLLHHAERGHLADPQLVCRSCGEELRSGDIQVERAGSGARRDRPAPSSPPAEAAAPR